jgi:polysaccharide export outer membrane protein
VDTYVIGVPDLLALKVWEQPDLSGEVLVRRDGKISVALVGDTVAAGRTPEELARQIEEGLSRFVADPRVDVAVVEMRSQVVSVIGGGIKKSGVIELRSDMRVIDAIAEMGGLTPFAKQRRIYVLRGEESYPFDYRAFMLGEEPQANFLLAPGDTVVVPE